ncbi:putative immunity protein [Mycobacterium sp. C31M]
MDELRVVTCFVAETAQTVLPIFEAAQPDDSRPRAAIEAAWEFANGAARSRLQRVASVQAHRAAGEAPSEAARLAARSAGDAASAAYLHPIARATQTGHILRAAASCARIAELQAHGDAAAASRVIDDACRRATPTVVDVLRRYPCLPPTNSRMSQLMATLDAVLRAEQG